MTDGGPENPAPVCVLVIDDEGGVRRVLARMLRSMGLEILEAADGVEGIEIYREQGERIDLIFLDMTMPKLSGRSTLLKIVEMDPEAKVVMMSGFDEPGEGDRAGLPGLLGFLPKPIQVADLGKWIEKIRTA